MNRIDFLKTGGFPVDLDTFDFMQSSWQMLQQMARAIAGNNPMILWGCEETGPTTASGYVIIQGEILPFQGGTTGDYIAVVETALTDDPDFQDGDNFDIYFQRKAIFTVTPGLEWADFTRVKSLFDMQKVNFVSLSELSTFGITFSTGWSATGESADNSFSLSYDALGNVEINMYVSLASNPSATINAFILPATIAPQQRKRFVGWSFNNDNGERDFIVTIAPQNDGTAVVQIGDKNNSGNKPAAFDNFFSTIKYNKNF